MKKRNFYLLLKSLRDALESAELDEAIKGDELFIAACHSMFDAYDTDYIEAKIEHKLACKKVRMLQKEIKEMEKIQNL